jgi:peptidoglycan hydrolase-like protein with peptidoglycan-binding domain
MVRTRRAIILSAVGATLLVGCSSDKDGATSSTGSVASSASSSTVSDDSSTSSSVDDASSSTSSTTAGTDSSSTVPGGSTTTTVPRVVTDPADSVHGGDTGPGVEQVQYALVAHGYDIKIDGNFGPQTENAVRDFQKNQGLKVDGIVGPITWARIQGTTSSTTSSVAAADGTTTTAAATTTTTT